ncbi:CorC-HlyC family protein YbeX [Gammaproteobacteria bacterium]
MKEDHIPDSVSPWSWFGRIGQAFSGEPQDREEIRERLRDAVDRGALDPDSLHMIEGVLQVSETRVREIMIPRSQMVVITQDATLDEILPLIVGSAHSRFPVVGENRDEVLGILLAKDLLGELFRRSLFSHDSEETPFQVRDLLRSVAFVPESKRLGMLLKEFRARRSHMAIVVNEYGGVSGLVTIENVLEQIVGDIGDEHDNEEDNYIIPQTNKHCLVNALARICDFNEYFETHFNDEDFDTVGGLVLNSFGRMPRKGEQVTMEGLTFKIMRADVRRLYLLQVSPAELQNIMQE